MSAHNSDNIDYSLYLVTDRGYIGERKLSNVIKESVEGGVTIVQLREKESLTREFIDRAHEIQTVLKKHNIPLIINDRIDVAMAVQADGVHLGQDDMPVELARNILGQDFLIGLSVENMEDIREAENMDVDYLGLSPLFTTATKPELKNEWGLEGLQKARKSSSHKIVAIGNIDSGNAADVIRSGADGIAVVSAICASENPKKAASNLSHAIAKGKQNK